jgi:hypothetical protein
MSISLSLIFLLHAAQPGLNPVVEAEEVVYRYTPADNGSGPLWCFGSTCLVRAGARVFASGLETLPDCPPLNNCRWQLYCRERGAWRLVAVDPKDRTREPCPLGWSHDGRLFLSANPTLVADRAKRGGGPARPEILEFSGADPSLPPRTILPAWGDSPAFTEHSYRNFAADGPAGELILFQNVGYSHSEWILRDRQGNWPARGKLVWPPYEDPKFEPYGATHVRVNYANVVLANREVHYCGIGSYNKWDRVRDDPELMGRENWGSRTRRLLYTWTPDVAQEPFRAWIEIAHTFATGGYLLTGDMGRGPDGRVHIVWTEYPIHPRLRREHFPDIQRIQSLKYAQVRDGEVVLRRTLVEGGEGAGNEFASTPRFQIAPDGRLILVYAVERREPGGTTRENRLMELSADGAPGPSVAIPLEHPLSNYFTATPRGGSAPSTTLDLLGVRFQPPPGDPAICYARVKLW